MTGLFLMKCLLAEYLLVAGVFAAERDYVRMLYWISAAGITLAVILMKGKA